MAMLPSLGKEIEARERTHSGSWPKERSNG